MEKVVKAAFVMGLLDDDEEENRYDFDADDDDEDEYWD